MSAMDSALATRLRAELDELTRAVDRVRVLVEKARRSGDADYLDGVALNLHGFYAGAERIFEEVARELDGSVPAGPEWHRDLLMQLSAEASRTRPALLSRETRRCLDEYRGFRHVVRHVYTFNLRPARLYDLADDLPACHAALSRDLEAFAAFLDGLP